MIRYGDGSVKLSRQALGDLDALLHVLGEVIQYDATAAGGATIGYRGVQPLRTALDLARDALTTRVADGGNEIEFHRDGEWTAVYLDGVLQRVGDSYLADEWLRARCGVVEVDDDAFMCGQSRYEGVAGTLAEVAAYREERDRLLAEAVELEQQGEALKQKAQELVRQAREPRT